MPASGNYTYDIAKGDWNFYREPLPFADSGMQHVAVIAGYTDIV
jgi:hypothetical protein